MATATDRALCATCNKERLVYSCRGCEKDFCLQHLNEHRQVLQGQFDQIINEHDQLKQTIVEQKQTPVHSFLIKRIDQWEKTSIETIQRTAQQCREVVIGQTRRVVDVVEEKLAQFTAQLKDIRQENEFNENDLQRLTNKLTEMTRELIEPSNISIDEDSQTLIHEIHISVSNPTQRQGLILSTLLTEIGEIEEFSFYSQSSAE